MRLLAVAAVFAVLGSGAAIAQAYSELYSSCENSGQLSSARIKACDKALAAAAPGDDGDRTMINIYRSEAKLSAGDIDGAIADADAAGRLVPRHMFAENQRCWARAVANRDLPAGRAACDIALDITEDNANVFDTSGLMALREGKWQLALDHYGRALKMDSRITTSQYGRGLAELALGKAADSARDLEDASDAADEFKDYGLTPASIKKRAGRT